MSNFETFEAQSLARDYGLTESIEAAGRVEIRPIEVIEGEILLYKQVAGSAIVEIGRRLIEAKEQLKHGEWERWLAEKVDFSTRSAQNYMRLAKGYGESATVALLGTRKALALLALEESEREEFLAEKHEINGEEKTAEDMSTEELERAIRERDEARRNAERADEEKRTAEIQKTRMEAEVQLANNKVKAADAEVKKLQDRIRKLESRPVEVAVQVDEAAVEKARQEGLAKGRKEAEEKAVVANKEQKEQQEKAIRELKEKLAKAEGDKMDAQVKAEELQKKLADTGKQNKLGGNEELVKFNIHFKTAQEQVQEMGAILRSLRAAGENDTADKLGKAMEALQGMIGEQMEEA